MSLGPVSSIADEGPAALSGFPCTVLLVDPDPLSAAAATALLEAENCLVLPLSTLETAVRMLDLIVVGVILADPLQEPLHSDTLAPLLRRAAGVPVLLFTSAAVGADEARAVGFAGVVNKPYDSESLLEAVRAAGRQAAEYAGPPRRAPRGFRPEEAVRAD